MALIRVDRDKCDKDGACVEVCPLGILALDEEKGPVTRPGSAMLCIGCGHCVAVCPHGALDNVKNPLQSQVPYERAELPDARAAFTFLRARRSVRRYLDRPVPRETTRQLLEIARFAPSGHNSQGLSYLAVEGREAIGEMTVLVTEWMRRLIREKHPIARSFHMEAIVKFCESGDDRILRNAPLVIVAMAPKTVEQMAQISTCLALEYVELYAPALGLGTCWAGYAQACAREYAPLLKYLKLPADRAVTGMLMAGFPKYHYHRLPERNPLDLVWFDEMGSAPSGP